MNTFMKATNCAQANLFTGLLHKEAASICPLKYRKNFRIDRMNSLNGMQPHYTMNEILYQPLVSSDQQMAIAYRN
jgi:hypothetical protein